MERGNRGDTHGDETETSDPLQITSIPWAHAPSTSNGLSAHTTSYVPLLSLSPLIVPTYDPLSKRSKLILRKPRKSLLLSLRL